MPAPFRAFSSYAPSQQSNSGSSGGGVIFQAPIYNPIDPGTEWGVDPASTTPIATAPIYAPGPNDPQIPGLNPGDWLAPDNPDPTDPGTDPGTDPAYAAAAAEAAKMRAELDNLLKLGRTRAITAFGDPELAKLAGFSLSPEDIAAAKANYASGNATLSRIDHNHTLARQAVINSLAAHGVLGSGDLGYRQGLENQQYGQNTYDAREKVMDYLQNLYQNYVQQQGQVRNNLLGAYEQWWQNQLNQVPQ